MATAARDKTPGQLFALAFGAVYLLVGLLGFAVTGFDDFFASKFNEVLIVFPVNPAHNLLLWGGVWVAGSRTAAGATAANMGIGIAYLAVFLLGVVGLLEWLAIEGGLNADQLLHLVTGALGVYFGTAGATARRPVTA